METLNPVEHDSANGSVASETVVVRLWTHGGVNRQCIPRSIAKEALISEAICKYNLWSSERDVLSHSSTELIVRNRCAEPFRSCNHVCFSPDALCRVVLDVSAVIHETGSYGRNHASICLVLRNYAPVLVELEEGSAAFNLIRIE